MALRGRRPSRVGLTALIIVAGVVIGIGVAGVPDAISLPRSSPPITIAADVLADLGEQSAPTPESASTTTSPPTTAAATTTTPATSSTTPATSSTTIAPVESSVPDTNGPEAVRPRDEVRIAVANGTNRDGVAALTAERLATIGYRAPEPTTAATRTATTVFAEPGYEAEAARLIEDLGLVGIEIAPAARRPLMEPAVTASIYLVLGRDFAG